MTPDYKEDRDRQRRTPARMVAAVSRATHSIPYRAPLIPPGSVLRRRLRDRPDVGRPRTADESIPVLGAVDRAASSPDSLFDPSARLPGHSRLAVRHAAGDWRRLRIVPPGPDQRDPR